MVESEVGLGNLKHSVPCRDLRKWTGHADALGDLVGATVVWQTAVL